MTRLCVRSLRIYRGISGGGGGGGGGGLASMIGVVKQQ